MPYKYFDNYLLPNAHERIRDTVFLLLFLRALTLYVTVIEQCRSSCYFCFLCFNAADQFTGLVDSLLKFGSLKFVRIYNCTSIVCATIKWEVNKIIYFFIACTFWGTVGSAFVLLKCWGKVDVAIYGCTWLVFVALSMEQVVIVPGATEVLVNATKVVLRNGGELG